MTKTVSADTFDSEVLQSSQPVLVDFWADWCGPCQTLAPVLEQLEQEFGELEVAKVNVDENMQTAMHYGVQALPTLMLFRGGEVVDSKVGALSQGQLSSWLQETLGSGA